jgi:hypothetical protein
MSNINLTNMTIASDGSVAIELGSSPFNEFYNHKSSEWFEVYGVEERNGLNPINGKYYCIGSGSFIIVAPDAVYNYERTCETYKLNKMPPCTCVLIRPVNQGNDSYINYIRVIKC